MHVERERNAEYIIIVLTVLAYLVMLVIHSQFVLKSVQPRLLALYVCRINAVNLLLAPNKVVHQNVVVCRDTLDLLHAVLQSVPSTKIALMIKRALDNIVLILVLDLVVQILTVKL